MDAKFKELLAGIAKCAGLTLDFPDGKPICISGFLDEDPPFFLIETDQPDSELIYNILVKIGRVSARERDVPLPWFLTRSYENETVGEIAYISRRVTRRKYQSDWGPELWAMCAYIGMGCFVQLNGFFFRHPEKWKLMPLIMYGMLKTQIIKILTFPFRIIS